MPRTKPPTFAARLRTLRAAAGLNQSALAFRAGLTSQAVCRLESGQRRPNWETVQALAQALDCTPNDFLENTHADPRTTNERPHPGR